MRKIKEYKTPTAQVIEFECADVITTSERALKTKLDESSPTVYVNAGGLRWSDGFNK